MWNKKLNIFRKARIIIYSDKEQSYYMSTLVNRNVSLAHTISSFNDISNFCNCDFVQLWNICCMSYLTKWKFVDFSSEEIYEFYEAFLCSTLHSKAKKIRYFVKNALICSILCVLSKFHVIHSNVFCNKNILKGADKLWKVHYWNSMI